jgi:hypothetical protein
MLQGADWQRSRLPRCGRDARARGRQEGKLRPDVSSTEDTFAPTPRPSQFSRAVIMVSWKLSSLLLLAVRVLNVSAAIEVRACPRAMTSDH